MTNESDRELLIRIDARTEELHRVVVTGTATEPSLLKRVDNLESARDSAKGWVAGAGAILALAWGGLEWVFHHGKH